MESKWEYGRQREIVLKPIIEKYFNDEIIKTKFKYTGLDFYSSKNLFFYELKAQTYSIKKYTDAIIVKKKLDLYDNIIIVYEYTNLIMLKEVKELYYIQYNKKLFDTFKIDNHTFNKPVIRIPVKYLTKIDLNEVNDIKNFKCVYGVEHKKLKIIEDDNKNFIERKYLFS
jgi:hypothetical protein